MEKVERGAAEGTHLRGSLVALELLDVELLDEVCSIMCSCMVALRLRPAEVVSK